MECAMFATHAVLNYRMWERKKGTIISILSIASPECLPFKGEAVSHASRALQSFAHSPRIYIAGSNILVAALRPGTVTAPFHLQRVQYDQAATNEFFQGCRPLVAKDGSSQCGALYPRYTQPHLHRDHRDTGLCSNIGNGHCHALIGTGIVSIPSSSS